MIRGTGVFLKIGLALPLAIALTCGYLSTVDAMAVPTKTGTAEKKTDKKDAKKKPLTKEERERLKAEAKLKALAKKFNLRLGQLKPKDSRKKTLDDYYITCTAQLNQYTREMDVCFQVRQGQQKVADFLADYVLNPPEKMLRNWHVIARFSSAEEAQKAVEETREQYDQMVAYRAALEQQYRAKKSRRC